MVRVWMIANSRSGSTSEESIAGVKAHLEKLRADISRYIDLAEEDLPSPGECPPDLIVSLGGDGTVNAVIDHYGAQEDLPLLVLPGGTMNLLSRKLHGDDADIGAILEKAFSRGGFSTKKLPMLKADGFDSLVGVIAGPVTAWGDVREQLREGGISAVVEKMRDALEQTFDGQPIRLSGVEGDHKAIFIEPEGDDLHAFAVLTEGVSDLAAHGWAWLNRDFLGGPTERLAVDKALTIESDRDGVGLLVDGERMKGKVPLVVEWAQCPALFVVTKEG